MKKNWISDGSGGEKTTYTGRRAKAAALLGADGKCNRTQVNRFTALFRADLNYLIKTEPIMRVSAFLLIVFTLIGIPHLFYPSFDHLYAAAGFILIIVSFIVFGRVRKVPYPNEEYSTFSLVLVGFVFFAVYACCILAPFLEVCFRNFEGLSVENHPIALGDAGIMMVSPIFYYVLVGLPILTTFICALIGYCKGYNRLGSMMSGLICLTGYFIHLAFVKLMFSEMVLNAIIPVLPNFLLNIYHHLVFGVGFVLLLSFDLVLCAISRRVGGRKDSHR